MKKSQRTIIVILSIVLIVIVLFILNATGMVNLQGTAGLQPGDQTEAITPQTPQQPTEAPPPSQLTLQTGEQTSGCSQVSIIIMMNNAAEAEEASNISVNIQVIQGAEYTVQGSTMLWRISSLSGGQSRLINLRINTNAQWLTAAAGTKITIKATIDSEANNPQENVGKSIDVTFTNAGGCQPPASPTATPKAQEETCKSWYLFHSLRTGDLEIFRLDGIEGRPGIRLYNLTNNGAADQNPSRSPDSLWIVFQSDRDGGFELYLVDAAGGNLRRLTDSTGDDTNPMFGPDNRTIVYQSNRGGNWDLYLYDRIAHEETQLTSGESDEINPYWSPNGRAVVYQTNRAGNWDLIIIDLTSGEETVLAAQPGNEIHPAYSPDGKHIAFLANPAAGVSELHVADTTTLGVTKITSGRATANPAWSPDSRSLAYEDTVEGNTDIFIYRFSTNSESRLTDRVEAESAPSWDCKGLNVFFTLQNEGGGDIYQNPITGGGPIAMTIDPGADLWPVFFNPKSFAPALP